MMASRKNKENKKNRRRKDVSFIFIRRKPSSFPVIVTSSWTLIGGEFEGVR